MTSPGLLPCPFLLFLAWIWGIWLYKHYLIPLVVTSFDIYSVFTLTPRCRGNCFVYDYLPEPKFSVTTTVIPDYLKTTILYNGKIMILEIYSLWWDLKRCEVSLVHPVTWLTWMSLNLVQTFKLHYNHHFIFLFIFEILFENVLLYMCMSIYLLPISWPQGCYFNMQALFYGIFTLQQITQS